MGQLVDFTGKQIGKWKVIRRGTDHITPKGHPIPTWLCECQCDFRTQREVMSTSLIQGRSKCCGKCKKHDKYKSIKTNFYEEENGYLRVFNAERTKSFVADKEDYEKISKYYWSNVSTHGYWECNAQGLLLHRYLLDIKDGMYVDHINRDRNDYRRDNLRVATPQQNNFNKGISKYNTSGVTGVRLPKGRNRWEARIKKGRHITVLGFFDTKEEATKCRLQAEKDMFGEFAPQRHLFKEYGIE